MPPPGPGRRSRAGPGGGRGERGPSARPGSGSHLKRGPSAGRGRAPEATARRAWVAALHSPAGIAALAALVLHVPSLANGFVRDDVPLIAENPLMRAPGGLWRLLAGDFLASIGYTSGLWRPLALFSFWLDGRLGNWSPVFFHATNVALHAGVAGVVGLLLTQAGLPRVAALAGALWFAAMPAHLEPVAWISGRTDLLCGGFALLGLWLDRRARRAGRAWPGLAALAAFTAALLSKEAAAAWVGVILVAERVRSRAHPTRALGIARWLVPYVAIALAWLVVHAWASGPAALPGYVDPALRARRMAAAWMMLPQQAAFLWPWYPHASDVPVWLPAAPLAGPVAGGAVFTLGVAVLALGLVARRSPMAVPCAIALVPLLPSLAVAFARGYVTSGERLAYLPSAGAAWLAAAALAGAWRGGRPARWGAVALGVALVTGSAVETLRLQPAWRDEESVFRRLTERHPGHAVGWIGLADALARADRGEQAAAALSRAQALDPRLPSVHRGWAELHYRRGDWAGVLEAAGRALELDEDLFEARLLRASTLVRMRRTAEAVGDIERLLRARPGHPAALTIEGQRLLAEGRAAEALPPLERAARALPEDAAVWFTLGDARAAAGDLGAARTAFERASALEPSSAAGWRKLAALHAALGDTVAARAALERAAALGPPPVAPAPGRGGP